MAAMAIITTTNPGSAEAPCDVLCQLTQLVNAMYDEKGNRKLNASGTLQRKIAEHLTKASIQEGTIAGDPVGLEATPMNWREAKVADSEPEGGEGEDLNVFTQDEDFYQIADDPGPEEEEGEDLNAFTHEDANILIDTSREFHVRAVEFNQRAEAIASELTEHQEDLMWIEKAVADTQQRLEETKAAQATYAYYEECIDSFLEQEKTNQNWAWIDVTGPDSPPLRNGGLYIQRSILLEDPDDDVNTITRPILTMWNQAKQDWVYLLPGEGKGRDSGLVQVLAKVVAMEDGGEEVNCLAGQQPANEEEVEV